MTWSYPIDQIQTNPMAQVRYLVRDTDSTDQLAQDEEINFVLGVHPNVFFCAAQVAEGIAGNYARKAETVRVGGMMLQYKTRDQNYRDLAANLRQQATRSGNVIPYAGGISLADKEANESNDDTVAPAFTRGMFDDSFATDKTNSNTDQEQVVSSWP